MQTIELKASNPKLCIECRHRRTTFIDETFINYSCDLVADVVTGHTVDCYAVRSNGGLCGLKGLLWESKDLKPAYTDDFAEYSKKHLQLTPVEAVARLKPAWTVKIDSNG
jgi:hypothetical protein